MRHQPDGYHSRMSLARVTRAAVAELDRLRFSEPVACVYDPLDYAWPLHEQWLRRYGQGPKEVLLLGRVGHVTCAHTS